MKQRIVTCLNEKKKEKGEQVNYILLKTGKMYEVNQGKQKDKIHKSSWNRLKQRNGWHWY